MDRQLTEEQKLWSLLKFPPLKSEGDRKGYFAKEISLSVLI